jgi:hypothetical protein
MRAGMRGRTLSKEHSREGREIIRLAAGERGDVAPKPGVQSRLLYS